MGDSRRSGLKMLSGLVVAAVRFGIGYLLGGGTRRRLSEPGNLNTGPMKEDQ